MRAERRKVLPAEPATVDGLDDYLVRHPKLDTFYRGNATSNDGGQAFVFIHPGMIRGLQLCTQLFCDGTFKVHTILN